MTRQFIAEQAREDLARRKAHRERDSIWGKLAGSMVLGGADDYDVLSVVRPQMVGQPANLHTISDSQHNQS